MKVIKIGKDEWGTVSRDAHLLTFGEDRGDLDTIDFSLLALDDERKAAGYVTCKEWDKVTLYWQYGGVMPRYKKTFSTFGIYKDLINWCKKDYFRITTKIENNNKAKLRMANMAGFLIQGTYNHHGKILVDHCLEFKGE